MVVVGAGIGGMATAARLSKAGCRCDQIGFDKKRLCLSIPVSEKNSRVYKKVDVNALRCLPVGRDAEPGYDRSATELRSTPFHLPSRDSSMNAYLLAFCSAGSVTVLEKNGPEQSGGRLNELVLEGGFRFDTGPSLLLLPEIYRETFRGNSSQFPVDTAVPIAGRVDNCTANERHVSSTF